MHFPQRFNVLPAYVFARFFLKTPTPGWTSLFRFLFQPGKIRRALAFLESQEIREGFRVIRLKKNPLKPLFVPAPYRWEDFCQTTDEILNPVNWHNFLSPDFSLTREDLVIDCGAAEGLFSWFADYQGSQVLAVEPDAAFAAGLHRTFAGQPSVRVVRAALSHRRGEGRISRRGIFSSLTSHADGDSVAVETVDTLTRGNKVTFLKADVEGHELRVLLGAEETLRQHQPRVAVTVYHDTNNPHEIREFLLACDSRYQFRTKGIYDNGNPVLLQAWVR